MQVRRLESPGFSRGEEVNLSSPGTTDPDRLAVALGALADKARASLAEAWRWRARKAWEAAQDRFDPHTRYRLV